VTGPGAASVNGTATFNITLTNRGTTATGKLIVKDNFDQGLKHPAAVEKRSLEYPAIENLAPGQTLKLEPLTFGVAQTGVLCHTVEVISVGQNAVAARQRICLQASAEAPPSGVPAPGGGTPANTGPGSATPPSPGGVSTLSVKLTGPPQQTQGQDALFNIQITNTGNRDLTNVKVAYSWDAALWPMKATEKCNSDGKNLIWVIERMPPGDNKLFQVNCRCAQAAAKACGRVNVSSAEGAVGQNEACMEIRASTAAEPSGGPPAGNPTPGGTAGSPSPPGTLPPESPPSATGLAATITPSIEPVASGKDLTYDIRVANNSTTNTIEQQVVVTAVVPVGMMPIPLGTDGPGPTKFSINQQTVTFTPILQIKPGETLVFHVCVRTKTVGQLPFHVEVKSQNLAQPLVREKITEVF
jgi:hypothetical protein